MESDGDKDSNTAVSRNDIPSTKEEKEVSTIHSPKSIVEPSEELPSRSTVHTDPRQNPWGKVQGSQPNSPFSPSTFLKKLYPKSLD